MDTKRAASRDWSATARARGALAHAGVGAERNRVELAQARRVALAKEEARLLVRNRAPYFSPERGRSDLARRGY